MGHKKFLNALLLLFRWVDAFIGGWGGLSLINLLHFMPRGFLRGERFVWWRREGCPEFFHHEFSKWGRNPDSNIKSLSRKAIFVFYKYPRGIFWQSWKSERNFWRCQILISDIWGQQRISIWGVNASLSTIINKIEKGPLLAEMLRHLKLKRTHFQMSRCVSFHG